MFPVVDFHGRKRFRVGNRKFSKNFGRKSEKKNDILSNVYPIFHAQMSEKIPNEYTKSCTRTVCTIAPTETTHVRARVLATLPESEAAVECGKKKRNACGPVPYFIYVFIFVLRKERHTHTHTFTTFYLSAPGSPQKSSTYIPFAYRLPQ